VGSVFRLSEQQLLRTMTEKMKGWVEGRGYAKLQRITAEIWSPHLKKASHLLRQVGEWRLHHCRMNVG
jgi:hypothetical protein